MFSSHPPHPEPTVVFLDILHLALHGCVIGLQLEFLLSQIVLLLLVELDVVLESFLLFADFLLEFRVLLLDLGEFELTSA